MLVFESLLKSLLALLAASSIFVFTLIAVTALVYLLIYLMSSGDNTDAD